MHQVLRIPEILLNIFGHCSTPFVGRGYQVDLAVLARTCQTFKEPALDVLWEELYDLSPLARCIPGACRLADPSEKHRFQRNRPCYSFSRPLKQEEWRTLRGYTRRVRAIRYAAINITEGTIGVVFSPQVSLDDPPFPRLRSLWWNAGIPFSLLHFAVPSLKFLYLDFYHLSPFGEACLRAFGDRCPLIADLVIHNNRPDLDSTISHVVCQWPNLRHVVCSGAALNKDSILHLSSISSLESLDFKVGAGLIQEISILDSALVFLNLKYLDIGSMVKPMVIDTITSLLHHIRMPSIEELSVSTQGPISRRLLGAYWAAVQEACPSNLLTRMRFYGFIEREQDGEETRLTLDDFGPRTAFTNLCELNVDFNCPVDLTDTDLLKLVSSRMKSLCINYYHGWQVNPHDGGITLSGLVQLLRRCPSLHRMSLVINTRTFTEIPEGLDVSFPPRSRLTIYLLDSYIVPEFVPGLVSVFTTLGMDSAMFPRWGSVQTWSLWESVFDALRSPT